MNKGDNFLTESEKKLITVWIEYEQESSCCRCGSCGRIEKMIDLKEK